jgi:membrane protein implicated in regulation of membrane protease activity
LAVAFGIGEMVTPGSFFLLPFGIGAGVAAILAFAGVSVAIEWLAFAAVSIGILFALRPLARRLDQAAPAEGIGSRRLIGRLGTVLESIPPGPHNLGLVRVDREEWRAESATGDPIDAEQTVRVTDVQGTRLLVVPAQHALQSDPKEQLS